MSSYMPSATGVAALPKRQLLSPQIELALLKSGLLTFDALLHNESNRFTRSPILNPLREKLRDIIMKDADPTQFLFEVSLGIQYEKRDLLCKIRKQVAFDHSSHEHFLIVSAHPPTRTLDLIVFLFDVHPYGFRLSKNWREGEFTYVVVNGVIRETGISGLVSLPSTYLLCQPTLRRCTLSLLPSDEDRQMAQQEVLDNEAHAIQKAQYHVLMKADSFVQKSFSYAALPAQDEPNKRMADVMRICLTRLYESRLSENKTQFDHVVAECLCELSSAIKDETVENESDLENISWDEWIGIFRKIVNQLCPILGYPGDSEFRLTEIFN